MRKGLSDSPSGDHLVLHLEIQHIKSDCDQLTVSKHFHYHHFVALLVELKSQSFTWHCSGK